MKTKIGPFELNHYDEEYMLMKRPDHKDGDVCLCVEGLAKCGVDDLETLTDYYVVVSTEEVPGWTCMVSSMHRVRGWWTLHDEDGQKLEVDSNQCDLLRLSGVKYGEPFWWVLMGAEDAKEIDGENLFY